MSSNLSNSIFCFQWRLSRLQHWPQCTFSAWALVPQHELQAKLDKEVHKWCNMPSKVTCIIKENCTLKQNLYLRFWLNISSSWCSAVCCVFWCILCFNLRNITSNLLVTNVVKCNFCFIRFATSFQINWTRNAIQHTYTFVSVLDLYISKPLWPSFRVSLVCSSFEI